MTDCPTSARKRKGRGAGSIHNLALRGLACQISTIFQTTFK